MSKTTTLGCAWHNDGCSIDVKLRDDGGVTIDLERNWYGSELASAKYAELLDALDAVPKSEVIEAEKGADEWKARAEAAEAKLANTETTLSEDVVYMRRLEAQLEEAVSQRDEARHWAETMQAQKFEAEAKLEAHLTEAHRRIVAGLDELKAGEDVRTVRSALLGMAKPFVLPTEVPARIEATRDAGSGRGQLDTLTLWTDGVRKFWRSQHDNQDWTELGAMERFTGHRVLGGDE